MVASLSKRLGEIRGVKAVVVGGSHARGRAEPGSDIDLGLFYSEVDPFAVQAVRELAEEVNDSAEPVVTDFYGWGPWINGGAWLTIGGQRVDFLYRSLEHLERVIVDAEAGRYQLDYSQQRQHRTTGPGNHSTHGRAVPTALCVAEVNSVLMDLNQASAVHPKPLCGHSH